MCVNSLNYRNTQIEFVQTTLRYVLYHYFSQSSLKNLEAVHHLINP